MHLDIQALRNLTTGKLHTKMSDIYETLEYLTGEKGIMTHHLPSAMKAIRPWLKERLLDARFWDDTFDPTHAGTVELEPMTPEDKAAFFSRFAALHDQ